MCLKTLITGVAGFIGMNCALRLLELGDQVVGLDNINDYYEVSLKQARLAKLQSKSKFEFCKIDVSDRNAVTKLFEMKKPNRVIHLAAQAGVRYSLENPFSYVDSNLQDFLNYQDCKLINNQQQSLVELTHLYVY